MVQNQKFRPRTSLGRRSDGPVGALLARGRVVEHVVDPVHQHGHPPDAAFGEATLSAGNRTRHPRPQPLGRGQQRVDREHGGKELERRAGGGQGGPGRRPGVEADHRAGLLAGVEERIPVLGEDRRVAELGRELGEADAPGSPGRRWPGPRRRPRPTSSSQGSCRGMMRSGMGPGPDLEVPPVPGPGAGQSRAPCPRPGRRPTPQNPATREGKQSEAQMPARSMSATRASMSKQPGRISSKRAGSMLHSLRGRPTTALSPMFG